MRSCGSCRSSTAALMQHRVTELGGAKLEDAFQPNIARKLANLDSNQLHMNRVLFAQQIRAGRGLLGWSRRDLAIVAGISQGTIKAIEQGSTDARLSTLRKLAQTFTAHGVEFVATGPWTGVVIKNKAGVGQSKLRRSESIKSPGNAEVAEEGLHIDEIGENGDEISASWRGLQWLGPLIRAAGVRKG